MDLLAILHPDDVVAKKSDMRSLAIVERTVHDIDTHVPMPGRTEEEPINHDRSIPNNAFRQFMRDGVPPKDTVLVRWRDEASMELLPISKVVLMDRSLLMGDIVKRRTTDAMSGCVLNTFTKCNLQPMCDISYQNTRTYKGILPPGKHDAATSQFCIYPNGKTAELIDIPASELTYAETLSEEDIVIYRDWIGRVEELDNRIRVRLADNCVVEIIDEEGEHVDGNMGGFYVGDVVKTKKGVLRTGRWIFGQYNPNTSPIGTVVGLRTAEASVTWLEKRIGSAAEHEPPVILESLDLDSPDFRAYDRTRRPRNLDLTLPTISNAELDVRLNLRVRFKDLTGAVLKYSTSAHPIPKLDRNDTLGYDLNVFDVTTFSTKVTVQWQDLTITTEKSIDLVPDGNIDDEHAAWPGEIVHSLNQHSVLGVENVKEPDRVGVVQSVNAEERMARVKWSPDSYVRYATDSDDESTYQHIIEHRISSVDFEDKEVSLYDIEAPAAMNVRRGDIVLINKADLNRMKERPSDVTWLGEIVDTRLDGKFVVRLGAASEVKDVVLSREEAVVAIRSDGTGQQDTWADEGMDVAGDFSDEDDSLNDYEDDSDYGFATEVDLSARYEDENGMQLDESEVENDDWESADEEAGNDGDEEMRDRFQTPPEQTPAISVVNGESSPAREAPERYEVLEGEVPFDHRYRNEPATTTSSHVKRTQKEHKILRNPSTLPDGVYIRTWESRLDLLRVLLIGPTETPYANAPFVVDVYLPSKFPQEPPQVFFHSWPAHASIGGLGRVNPNLYEDGKICLSLLGTWDGAEGESWNAARSTLLQVIVSLLGLVLVREPYYNEAGYESLVGNEASKRPSALYSERVFVRAKGFLVTALLALEKSSVAMTKFATGLDKLEDILTWLYRNPDGPRLLQATTNEVNEVLARSDGTREPDGLTVMTKGAVVSVERLLDRLRLLASEEGQLPHEVT